MRPLLLKNITRPSNPSKLVRPSHCLKTVEVKNPKNLAAPWACKNSPRREKPSLESRSNKSASSHRWALIVKQLKWHTTCMLPENQHANKQVSDNEIDFKELKFTSHFWFACLKINKRNRFLKTINTKKMFRQSTLWDLSLWIYYYEDEKERVVKSLDIMREIREIYEMMPKLN